ncbi:PREDICTED: orcokinin peptides type A-like [Polistes canadensis]|uniref:orcokinin peptides type A-like n=1 Tax=Polistes canadensis TaxID=91411 RepID=UPI000718DFDF|nr:PREDICTED: orcokinin peptides type A-like [Polistes canadensis]
MKTRVISSFIASIYIVACTSISALQVQNDANQLQRENYEPIVTDFLVKYLDDRKPGISKAQKIIGMNEQSVVKRNLDQIGGGNLVRSVPNFNEYNNERSLRNLDQIGGGNLVRDLSNFKFGAKRNLDQIGGGNLVRNLDHIGGGNLVRNLDQIGGGNLVRNLDQIGGGNLVRNLDQIGGGNLVRDIERFYECIPDGHNLDGGIAGGHLLRSTRRNLDFYPALIYEKQRYFPLRKPATLNTRLGDYDDIHPFVLDRLGKRNFDEIDANAFDNFYKRNFDEIDRVGWSGFVKRLTNYLVKQQQLQQRQQQQQR